MLTGARIRAAQTLSIVVAISGTVVIAGWILDISVLKSISPAWISMKLTTALAFILSGITLYFIAGTFKNEFDRAQVAISITSLTLILLMGTLFFSHFLNVHTGIEDIFVRDTDISGYTVVPGRPSLPTMFGFMLIALAGIITLFRYSKLGYAFKAIGIMVGLIGALPVAGYIGNIPALYYFVSGVSSAIALHTAILFIMIGAGFICLSD